MSRLSCKKTCSPHSHFNLEVFVDNTDCVVWDMITRKPDIFQFLLIVLQSQSINPARFRPVPTWFATVAEHAAETKTDNIMNMTRFRDALSLINLTWRDLKCETDNELMSKIDLDAYMLARFMILSCSLQLDCVNKVADTATWQQYKVTWDETIEHDWEFQGRDKTPEYLYHGSPLANWYSIMRNGLQVTSNTPWMSNGAAMGVGIYCSDSLTVSWGYSHGGIGQIVVGVYEVWGAEQYQKKQGYFVVPNAENLLLRYIIYIPHSENINVLLLDKSLHNEWLNKGAIKAEATRKKNIKIESRINKEIMLFKNAGIEAIVINTEQVRILTKEADKNIQCDIWISYQFPFTPPVFHKRDKEYHIENWTPKSTLLAAFLSLK